MAEHLRRPRLVEHRAMAMIGPAEGAAPIFDGKGAWRCQP
jgi:hypothetical protein